ncbi:MAG: YlbF family regulator [Ruminococcaceae bacterium]|nr:YlbF family regulator [Oscillospiraceae bacterium]
MIYKRQRKEMNEMNVIELARNLGKAIQEDPDYAKLEQTRKANDADEALQALIEKFNLLGMTMEVEAGKNEPDEARIDKLNAEMMELYSKILENETMAAFNEAKAVMDQKMDEVVAILAAAVNGEDPMTFDPNAQHSDGCGGDCSCCSGCH